MDQLLDSRLEALAFNYVSFGIFTIVNNLWTWVAVFTAAVSFWTIRAAGAAAVSSCSVDQKATTSFISRTQDDSRPIQEAEEKATPSADMVLLSAPSASPLVCDDGVTKGGKFRLAVYYEDDEESDVDGETTVNEWRSDAEGGCCGGGEWWEGWERVLRLRNGETGWYRYQDLTVINGNVVRLWDESKTCRRKGRYSSSCAVWW
ncbi:hypothetical protein PTKIN_Ptkin19aG0091800 [Pterospermum kingtungense]